MRAKEFLNEHKKGVIAKKYNTKPRPAINHSIEFAKQQAKINTPVPVKTEGVFDAIGNKYKELAPGWAGGNPPPLPAVNKPAPVVPTAPAADVAATVNEPSFSPSNHIATLKATAVQAGITNPDDIANLLGQCAHETGNWKKSIENMVYTDPKVIYKTFTSLFKGPNDPLIKKYIGNPVALANDGYAKKGGNSQPGDGWKYRGRGFMMLSGRDNYRIFGKAAHSDDPNIYLDNPALLSTDPEESALSAVMYFLKRVGKGVTPKQASKAVSGSTKVAPKQRKLATQQAANLLKPAK